MKREFIPVMVKIIVSDTKFTAVLEKSGPFDEFEGELDEFDNNN